MVNNELAELLNLDVTNGIKSENTTKAEVMKMIKDLVANSLEDNGKHIFIETSDNQFKETPYKIREDFENFCKSDNKMKPTLQIKMEEYRDEDRKYYHFFVLEDPSAYKTNTRKSTNKRKNETEGGGEEINLEQEKTKTPFTLNEAEQKIMEVLKECKGIIKANELADKVGFSQSKTNYTIQHLQRLKIIERVNSGVPRWELLENPYFNIK